MKPLLPRLRLAIGIGILGLASVPAADTVLPEADWRKLPAWRGFNLLGFFHRDWSSGGFAESDFQILADEGFNFVRIPIDYRVYIAGDWETFDPAKLAQIDDLMTWGATYGVHVQLCLHRIPGYTVASPAEATDLFTDAETLRVAAVHWAMFAERYAEIPNSHLSFNLFNEPADVTPAAYVPVVTALVAAIREHDPDRLIVADGLQHARQPVPELIPLEVAQAVHMYEPFQLTHYRASWVNGSDTWSVPTWPVFPVSAYLYGSWKADHQTPLRLLGPFPEDTTLRMRVQQVSIESELTVFADGVEIFSHSFLPGPGTGEWKEVVATEWGYQNVYDRDYFAVIPAGTGEVEIRNGEGDWLTLAEIGLTPAGSGNESSFVPGDSAFWSTQDHAVRFDAGDPQRPLSVDAPMGVGMILQEYLEPWLALRDDGVGVMVGEWGVHRETPHAVTVQFMRDAAEAFTVADFGWALWNLSGSFGPLDSGRSDVNFESYRGHQLDRTMLDLLREFALERESFTSWSRRLGEQLNLDPGLLLPEADYNRDGVSNLYEFAVDGRFEPVSQDDAIPWPTIGSPPPGGEHSTIPFSFSRARRPVGLEHQIFASADLLHWTPVENPPRLESEDGTAEHLRLEVPLMEDTPSLYLRHAVRLIYGR